MGLIQWVNDENNQKALKYIGSGIVVVVATVWMGYKEFASTIAPDASLEVNASAAKAVAPDVNVSTPAPIVQTVTADNGKNAVGNIGEHNTIIIGN